MAGYTFALVCKPFSSYQWWCGRSNTGCWIVRSSNREKFTAKADFQSCCHWLVNCSIWDKYPTINVCIKCHIIKDKTHKCVVVMFHQLLTSKKIHNQEYLAHCAAAVSSTMNKPNLIKLSLFFCCFTKYLFSAFNRCHQTALIFLYWSHQSTHSTKLTSTSPCSAFYASSQCDTARICCGAPAVQQLGNANPKGIFQTLVYGFDGIQTRVPRYVGLIMSVGRAAGTVQLVVTCQRHSLLSWPQWPLSCFVTSIHSRKKYLIFKLTVNYYMTWPMN